MMKITIYHNPRCSKSRQTLALLTEAGFEPEVVDYQKTGWSEAQLKDLFAVAGVTAREALRAKTGPAPELGLANADDATVLAAMVDHPILVERPIVVVGNAARICRPPERVWEIVERPSS